PTSCPAPHRSPPPWGAPPPAPCSSGSGSSRPPAAAASRTPPPCPRAGNRVSAAWCCTAAQGGLHAGRRLPALARLGGADEERPALPAAHDAGMRRGPARPLAIAPARQPALHVGAQHGNVAGRPTARPQGMVGRG